MGSDPILSPTALNGRHSGILQNPPTPWGHQACGIVFGGSAPPVVLPWAVPGVDSSRLMLTHGLPPLGRSAAASGGRLKIHLNLALPSEPFKSDGMVPHGPSR